MSQITLRGIDPEIEKEIRKIAKNSRQSINNVLTEIIRNNFQSKKLKPQATSLRHLAGGWSRQNAMAFLNSINSCEQIDEAKWK